MVRQISILKITCFIIFVDYIVTDASPIFWYCQENWGLYTEGSTYQSNLNKLLLPLATNASSSARFAQMTVANGTDDQIFGAAMCYADVNSTSCQNCLATAISEIVVQSVCRGRRTAGINYDACLLHYYDNNFSFSKVYWGPLCLRYSEDSSSPFFLGSPSVQSLMNQLAIDASSGSGQYFASGEIKYTDNQTIYGLVQCTRDLTPNACQKCINGSISYGTTRKNNCSDSEGARIMSAACYLRYELSNFTITEPPNDSPITAPPSDSPITAPPIEQDNSHDSPVVIIAVSVSVAFLLILSTILFFLRRRCLAKKRNNTEDEAYSSTVVLHENMNMNSILNPDVAYVVFDLYTLRDATGNFSEMNMLGKGGFGLVYKGILQDGHEVAVKRLSGTSMQGLRELKNEVDFLAKLKHKNLVQLLGCCIEKQEKLLCYELLSKGSLDKILFTKDPSKRGELSWNMRYKIIEGISRGLHYLHEESRMKIIHRDLKASNILLDKDMNPKISNFGLARLFEDDQTHKDTSIIAGTFGYMAPEYVLHGNFSMKSDVYSFGILLMEIVTGQKNSSFYSSTRVSNLVNYVWRHWIDETIHEMMDPMLADTNLEEFRKCIHIALLCVHDHPVDRPSMGAVNHMLSGHSKTLPDAPSSWQVSRNIPSNDSESITIRRSSMAQQSSMSKSTSKSLQHDFEEDF